MMRLTSKGFKLLLSSALVATLGLLFADALLVGAAMAVLAYLIYIYWEISIGLRRIGQVRVSPERVEGTIVAGAKAEHTLHIVNPLQPSLTLTPSLSWGSLEPGSPPMGDSVSVFSFKSALSGLYHSENLKAVLSDRWGTVEGLGEVGFTASFKVYPRVFPAALEALALMYEGVSSSEATSTTRVGGRGIEYAESREYVPGDPIRLFDWKAMARTGKPYVKQYYAESMSGVRVLYDPVALDPYSLDQLNASLLRLLLSVIRTDAPTRLDVMDRGNGVSSIAVGRMNVLETGFKIALRGMIEEFREYYTVIDPGRVRLYDAAMSKVLASRVDQGSYIESSQDDLVLLSSLSRDPLTYMKHLQWSNSVHSVIQPCEPWVWAESLQGALDTYAEINRKLRVIERSRAMVYLRVEDYLTDYIRGAAEKTRIHVS